MDNTNSTLTESGSASPNCMNGSMRRPSPGPCTPTGAGGRPASLMDHNQSQPNYVVVVVNRDEKGYGMKVSGDNPVYVQSVKEGGAAERAGLHAGDKIIKVNGVNVMQSTHTQVVALIKSSSQVELTVQQRSSGLRNMASPSVHTRPVTTPTSSRITGPQPVDNEKQHQLQLEKEQYYRLMIEKEQHYVDLLRSQIASSPDEKKCLELAKTERNLQTLQAMLLRSQSESPNPTHHRTKSSPETLMVLSGVDGSRKLSESMNDLRQEEWEGAETPPGTPPPPYPSPQVSRRDRICIPEDGDTTFGDNLMDSPDASPFRGNGSTRVLANSSPIHAANPQVSQEPIISMEDDEISDQEINQFKDHGYFKSLSKLWEHLPHLAVFTNYILSNSDPNSLMFYLLTDLYKEGNAKEMRKWAFEIHSCFLVPGAPLRLSNVDENIAREIDDVLTKEFDKEDRLRKIFWKARSRAKEELTRLLAEFQQKRTAGLGTIFGPTDQALAEVYNDKAKETKLYETLFLEKLDPYLDEIEKENCDLKRYYTAAAFTTVLTRIFQIRPAPHALDRCPTFVSKEKSFRTKFIGKYSRKLSVFGHQYIAQQYYTVIGCNNCHQIIFGISPQGYQCSVCHINLHRHCVKLYDDSCPGPIIKKERGIRKLIGMKDNTDHSRIKKTSHFLQMEKERRQMEERDSSFEQSESGDVKQGQPVSRSGSDRRPDAVREEGLKVQDSPSTTDSTHDASEKAEVSTPDSTTSLPATGSKRRINSNINRSESVKEQSEKRKQRRNISDPSHNTTGGDVDLDRQPGLSNTDSGSSSNSSISCNGRLSESPSNSVDTVGQTGPSRGNLDSDSDMDVEAEPWQSFVPPEELRNLPPHEKKRQDVINELFHTEGSHVRNLKVLYKIFYKKLQESQILKPEELNLMFPNIKEMLDLHTEINKAMRRRRKEDSIVKEIGDILVNMFDDRQGESLKKAAANFCERQQLALEFIKRRRERDSKFEPCCRNAKRSDSAGDCLFRVSFPRKCRGCRSTPFSSRDSSTV
uniref:Rho guanine nucleotide exchange factor 12 n=1 Tax=Anoplophora glabripennis TaxID=217634 RepID=V5GUT4_ANOGL